jgi:hypothetical protein
MGVSERMEALYRESVKLNDTGAIEKFHTTFKQWRKDYEVINSESKKAEHELINKVAE